MGLPKWNMETPLDNSVQALIEYDYDGLIGVEAATGYWGLSTFNTDMSTLLFCDNTLCNDGYFTRYSIGLLFVPNVNTDNVVKLSEHLLITDREQTVVDMVRYNRHEFHLYETVISAYDDGEVDIERMEKIAEQYGVLEKLRETYNRAIEEIDWDNE